MQRVAVAAGVVAHHVVLEGSRSSSAVIYLAYHLVHMATSRLFGERGLSQGAVGVGPSVQLPSNLYFMGISGINFPINIPK